MNQVSFEKRPEGQATMSSEMRNADHYYKWIMDQLTPYAGDKVLDIGGGFGAHLPFILPVAKELVSVELSQDSVDFMLANFTKYGNFDARRFDFGADDIQTLIDENYDTIIILNVLEHIEDDVTALRQMHSIIQQQNGRILLQVPALQWIYGTMDEDAGHYRRYTRAEVATKLDNAGFEVEQCYYFNIFGILPWYLSGRVRKGGLDSDSINWQIKVFNSLAPAFRMIESVAKPPMGQSVMAVARAK